MKIIGLTGRAKSGKDTAASFLQTSNSSTHAFAKPLKDAAQILYNLSDSQLYDQNLKEVPIPGIMIEGKEASPRLILQWLGTQLRSNDKDFFVHCMERKLERGVGNFIITDVRYDNEAELIKKYGGVIIHIERPGIEKVNAHDSEDGIRKELVDYWVINDGTLEEFEGKVRGIIH